MTEIITAEKRSTTTETVNTRKRLFVWELCQELGGWDRVVNIFKPLIKQDNEFVSRGCGRDARYTVEEIIEVVRLYLYEGNQAVEVVRLCPYVENRGVIALSGLVRDILILAEPEIAQKYGYSQSNCSRRALRAFGIEFRTYIQEVYRDVLTSPRFLEAFENSSDLNEDWKNVLREFQNPFANLGKVIEVSPGSAIEMVRLVFIEGYGWNHAAEIVGLDENPSMIRRIAFVSVYVLRDLVSERAEKQLLKPDFSLPVLTGTENNQILAEKMLLLSQEREQLCEVVEDLMYRYEGRGSLLPYLNPLQLAVLEAYTSGDLLQMIAEFEKFGITRSYFLSKLADLRKLALGQEFDGVCPFRSEFRDLIFYHAYSSRFGVYKTEDFRDQLWLRVCRYSGNEILAIRGCKGNYLLKFPFERAVFDRIEEGMEHKVLKLRVL